MKQTEFTKMVDDVVELKMKAVDKYIEEIIEPLGEIGNPEKLIGKPYEQWTPLDLQMLGQIYGPEPNELSKLIFKKEYAKLIELEKEV